MFYRSVFHYRQFRYLGSFYLHSIIRLFALSLFQLFNGLYIFQIGQGIGLSFSHCLALVAFFFCAIYAFEALFIPITLWLIARKGLRFSVFWGNICLIGFLGFLALAKFDPILLIFAAFLCGGSISLYWTAYHAYFAELSDDKKQGEEISISGVLSNIVSIGGPAFGGLIINTWGYQAALAMMSVLVIIAVLPLRYLPKQEDRIGVHIMPILKSLSPKKEFKSFISITGWGVMEQIFMVFWPLYIFPIVFGIVGVGFMGSLVALIGVFSIMGLGILIDRIGAKKVLLVSGPVDAVMWILGMFVFSPLSVYVLSAVASISRVAQNIAMDSIIYERARHNDLMAFIVQRSLSLAVGRMLFLLILGVLFWFGMPLVAVLIFAAMATILTRFYPKGN